MGNSLLLLLFVCHALLVIVIQISSHIFDSKSPELEKRKVTIFGIVTGSYSPFVCRMQVITTYEATY